AELQRLAERAHTHGARAGASRRTGGARTGTQSPADPRAAVARIHGTGRRHRDGRSAETGGDDREPGVERGEVFAETGTPACARRETRTDGATAGRGRRA